MPGMLFIPRLKCMEDDDVYHLLMLSGSIRKGDITMAKATWDDEVLAESDQSVLVEGNIYFPPDSVKREFLRDSERQYTCHWKGQAGYYDVIVSGKVNKNAAWYYYEPSEAAKTIKDYVAFDEDSGIKVEGTASRRLERP